MFGVYGREAEQVLVETLRGGSGRAGEVGTVGPEDMLFAMLGEPSRRDVARRVLDEQGITRESLARVLRRGDGRPEDARTPPQAPFDAEMNLCLRRALQLALEDGSRIGTEHLLLGVLYERTTPVAAALKELGLTYEGAFDAILRTRRVEERGGGGDEPPVLIPDRPQRQTRGSAVLPELALQVAEDDPAADGRLGTHHFLLALAMEGETGDPGGLAGRVLRSFGLSYPVLLARVRELGAAEGADLGSDAPELVTRPPEWPLFVDDLT